MSGKPQFDESAVIDAAVGVFWRHGFAAASISDLTEATGLSRSSLYQRFGDKEGAFLEALQAYTERAVGRMESTRAGTARGRIEALLRMMLPRAGASSQPTGCLIARSCSEAADLTSAGQLAAAAAAARQQSVIGATIREAAQNGELAAGSDVDALGWYYFSVMQAVVNLAGIGVHSELIGRVIDVAMASWPVSDGDRSA